MNISKNPTCFLFQKCGTRPPTAVNITRSHYEKKNKDNREFGKILRYLPCTQIFFQALFYNRQTIAKTQSCIELRNSIFSCVINDEHAILLQLESAGNALSSNLEI